MISGTFTANGTLVVPANTQFVAACMQETAGFAVTFKIGTTPGGTEVYSSVPLAANGVRSSVSGSGSHSLGTCNQAAFPAGATLYIQSANWNGASITAGLVDFPLS